MCIKRLLQLIFFVIDTKESSSESKSEINWGSVKESMVSMISNNRESFLDEILALHLDSSGTLLNKYKVKNYLFK